MAVSSTVTLPALPAQGALQYIPLGGDGKTAPLGCYFVRLEIDGDAGGGNATMSINLDVRYTNLVAYVNLLIQVDAAAGDFMLGTFTGTGGAAASPNIVGTIPQVATAVNSNNGMFLWYPPPVFYQQEGQIFGVVPNVSATETYKLAAEILVFDADIRRLTPLPWLMQNVPGVSAPAAI